MDALKFFGGLLLLIVIAILLTVGVISLISIWNNQVRQRFARLLALYIVVLVNGVLGLVAFMMGAMIAFSACFKQTCSVVESSAMIWIPASVLLLSIAGTILILRKGRYERLVQWTVKSSSVSVTIVVVSVAAVLAVFNF